MKFNQFLCVLQKIVIYDNTYNILCCENAMPGWSEKCKKRKAGRSPSSFSSYPQVSGVFDEREILVLYAADIDFFIKFIEINISK